MPPVGRRCNYPPRVGNKELAAEQWFLMFAVLKSQFFFFNRWSQLRYNSDEWISSSLRSRPQVNKVLRNHNIKPHWMFALDNIIRKAVQTAITILVPGNVVSPWSRLHLNTLSGELSAWWTQLAARCVPSVWLKGADVPGFQSRQLKSSQMYKNTDEYSTISRPN